jgi:hypothetical protein
VFYYEGELDNTASNFKSSTFKEIREVLINKKNSVKELKDFVVILKPSEECNYKNVVDILDEMAINVCTRYALVDITSIETQLVKKSEEMAATTPGK